MSAPEHRDITLEELAVAIRDVAPQPDPDFAAELDRRVEEGFAKPSRFRMPRVPRVRLGWMPALGAAAALIVAVVVAAGLLSGGDGEQQQTETAAVSRDLGAPPPGAGPVSDFSHFDKLQAAQSAAGAPERRVERSAQLTIAAPADDLQRVGDDVGRVAEAHRGFVVSSSVSTGADSRGGGSFVLRVPSSQLEAVLGELGKLGKVRARSESSQDVTSTFRGTENRLANLLLERRATLDKLRRAKGTPDEDAVRARLRRLDADINGLSDRMRHLRRRTVYSTVNVTLEQRRGGAATAPGGGPGKAFHDALDTLSGALELCIRALGVVLPLALLAALAWLVTATLRRRRREAALF